MIQTQKDEILTKIMINILIRNCFYYICMVTNETNWQYFSGSMALVLAFINKNQHVKQYLSCLKVLGYYKTQCRPTNFLYRLTKKQKR